MHFIELQDAVADGPSGGRRSEQRGRPLRALGLAGGNHGTPDVSYADALEIARSLVVAADDYSPPDAPQVLDQDADVPFQRVLEALIHRCTHAAARTVD